MKLYQKLSQIGFLKNSYVFKFLFVAFIGIHIPLIGLLFFVLYSNNAISPHSILIFALLITLIATAITLLILKQLIKPIQVASQALHNYRKNRLVSSLPTIFTDEAGLLLSNIQDTIVENEIFLTEKQDLVYLLSHDLKNFAGNSQGLAKLILEENPSDTIKEFAELICESTNKQIYFTESFIKLLKEQDEIVNSNLALKTVKLQYILSSVEEQILQKMNSKSIRLISSIKIKKVNLKVDEDLLIHVLVNLIDNAIKFSLPNSEILLKIYSENERLIFTVIDNGIGFDPNETDNLFQKFTSMSRLGTLNEASTGIGLYLCRKAIEKRQGELVAYSEGKNKGATFSVILPF